MTDFITIMLLVASINAICNAMFTQINSDKIGSTIFKIINLFLSFGCFTGFIVQMMGE